MTVFVSGYFVITNLLPNFVQNNKIKSYTTISDLIEIPRNSYKISYTKIGNPTGTRKLKLVCCKTFEEIIQDYMLNVLTNSVYQQDYWHEMAERHVKYKRTRGAGNTCTYHITFKSLDKKMDVIAKYEIEIECEKNTAGIDLLSEEENKEEAANDQPQPPSKKTAKWVQKEGKGVRNFLILLSETKDIDKLRNTMSKASFYRNLKICEEKGYVKEGQLLRKVMV